MQRIPTHHRLALAATALVAIAAGCAGDDDSVTPVADAAEPAVGAQISTAQTSLGEVLVDPEGLSLYAFTDDTDGQSTCFDSCADAWPPVDGDLPVADGLESVGFDAVERPDGTAQLRVAGRWPLYTFAGDAGPGDVTGQASAGVWFAVAPDGTLIGLDADSPATTAPADGDTAVTEPTEDAGVAPEPGVTPESAVETELGPVLTNIDGLTVYAFANDVPGESNCLDPCSETWPPVDADAVLNPAPDPARLSVVERSDGIDQVAVDGHLLYTFVDDVAPGDVNGQGVGDVWFAVSAELEVLVPPTVRVGSTDAGDVLIDPDGFTVYTFANDRPGVSACDDPCSTTWPPVPGDTRLGASLEPDQFGQVTRSNGQSQLTFNDQPLYTYSGDENPGDANGVLVGDAGTWAPVPADIVAQLEDVGIGGGSTAAPSAPSDIEVVETEIGHVLADADGLTLYGFLNDNETESACNDACADAWPPIPGDVAVDPEVVTASTSTIERADGASQLVIGAWPAYTFAGDAGPGDVNGQGSGDVWFAIAPDGSLIR